MVYLIVVFLFFVVPTLSAEANPETRTTEATLNFAAVHPADRQGSADQATGGEQPANVQWRRILTQSALAMGFQHAFRLSVQADTRSEMGGPFWRDYGRAIKGIRGWGDSDSFVTNYVGHPIMGAVAGYIYTTNDSRGSADFGGSKQYWTSRMRATAYSAAYSTMFELGPVSETSIGNVGIEPNDNGAVDFVVTPVGGLGWMVAEDALDKYIIRRLERTSKSRWFAATLRCVLTPARSLVELTRFRPPWRRPGRKLER